MASSSDWTAVEAETDTRSLGHTRSMGDAAQALRSIRQSSKN